MKDTTKENQFIALQKELNQITGNHNLSIIIKQFIYWSTRCNSSKEYKLEEYKNYVRSSHSKLNYGWIYKSAESLINELALTSHRATVNKWLTKIVEKGWLSQRSNPKYKWDKTYQYRVNISKIIKTFTDLNLDCPYLLDLINSFNPGNKEKEVSRNTSLDNNAASPTTNNSLNPKHDIAFSNQRNPISTNAVDNDNDVSIETVQALSANPDTAISTNTVDNVNSNPPLAADHISTADDKQLPQNYNNWANLCKKHNYPLTQTELINIINTFDQYAFSVLQDCFDSIIPRIDINSIQNRYHYLKEALKNELNKLSSSSDKPRKSSCVSAPSGNKFNNFTQRSYSKEDYRKMEQLLLNKQ